MATINDIWNAYDEGESQWTGCDWPTHYGTLGLDLNGIRACAAHQVAKHWCVLAADEEGCGDINTGEEDCLVAMAEHLRLPRAVVYVGEDQEGHPQVLGQSARHLCAETLAGEWELAAHWLEEIESDALWAEAEAQEAVAAAENGAWEYALRHARQACSIESGYDEPRPWRHLKRVIEEAGTQGPSLAVAFFEQ
jgi:hypothetical protein